ncbi:unnamed protein product [Brugia pahangi]|uniref:Abhydrolase_3 domain-containing protein n=1 Tax=Brugia pahangi TaxID=6280 RepID=A0A0N4TUX9_BRUPA|nr:unnamed protein product [Brugia pahangi]
MVGLKGLAPHLPRVDPVLHLPPGTAHSPFGVKDYSSKTSCADLIKVCFDMLYWDLPTMPKKKAKRKDYHPVIDHDWRD